MVNKVLIYLGYLAIGYELSVLIAYVYPTLKNGIAVEGLLQLLLFMIPTLFSFQYVAITLISSILFIPLYLLRVRLNVIKYLTIIFFICIVSLFVLLIINLNTTMQSCITNECGNNLSIYNVFLNFIILPNLFVFLLTSLQDIRSRFFSVKKGSIIPLVFLASVIILTVDAPIQVLLHLKGNEIQANKGSELIAFDVNSTNPTYIPNAYTKISGLEYSKMNPTIDVLTGFGKRTADGINPFNKRPYGNVTRIEYNKQGIQSEIIYSCRGMIGDGIDRSRIYVRKETFKKLEQVAKSYASENIPTETLTINGSQAIYVTRENGRPENVSHTIYFQKDEYLHSVMLVNNCMINDPKTEIINIATSI